MSDMFMGQITAFGFNFAPRGWAQCNGQSMALNQNQALYSLLGTTYGGNGQTTFNLPDLRGRSPIHMGQGPGLPNYDIGQSSGNNQITLTQNQLPAHAHPLTSSGQACTAAAATTNNPTNAVPAAVAIEVNDPNGGGVTATALAYAPASDGSHMSGGSGSQTGPAGVGQSVDVTNPYLAVNWCICTQGVYPSRN